MRFALDLDFHQAGVLVDWAVIAQDLMGFEVHLETPEILEPNFLVDQLRTPGDFVTVKFDRQMILMIPMILIPLKVVAHQSTFNQFFKTVTRFK